MTKETKVILMFKYLYKILDEVLANRPENSLNSWYTTDKWGQVTGSIIYHISRSEEKIHFISYINAWEVLKGIDTHLLLKIHNKVRDGYFINKI